MSVRIVLVALALALGVTSGACFDDSDEIVGLACSNDMHCPGGGLVCFNGACAEADDVSTTMTTSASTSVSTTADACATNFGSCAGGEVCCTGTCTDDGQGFGNLLCLDACAMQTDCEAGCCAFRPELSYSVCEPC